MKLLLVAVGQKIPAWAQTACDDFASRFGGDLRLVVHTVKTEPRTTGKTTEALMAAEAQRIEAAIESHANKGARRVVLDERGNTQTTAQLAQRIRRWQEGACDVTLIMGGPDGLAVSLKESAHETLRLSELTLPHALARVLMIEALYRAWSVNQNHPYHRE